MKKYTFKQLNIYLLLMYLVSGLLMALALFVYTRFLDNWCIEHKDEIHKYPGKVTACYPKNPSHGQPFNIEIDLSNGRHVLIVDNDKMKGSVLVYAYESGAVNYYTFTERTLAAKVNGAQRRFVVFLIVILALVPLAIYLWLIRTRRSNESLNEFVYGKSYKVEILDFSNAMNKPLNEVFRDCIIGELNEYLILKGGFLGNTLVKESSSFDEFMEFHSQFIAEKRKMPTKILKILWIIKMENVDDSALQKLEDHLFADKVTSTYVGAIQAVLVDKSTGKAYFGGMHENGKTALYKETFKILSNV